MKRFAGTQLSLEKKNAMMLLLAQGMDAVINAKLKNFLNVLINFMECHFVNQNVETEFETMEKNATMGINLMEMDVNLQN